MRKPIAVNLDDGCVGITCDDGSMWILETFESGWKRLPDIPQDESDITKDMRLSNRNKDCKLLKPGDGGTS